MKDQYFGDINDFRKYGLLRCLLEVTKLRLGVCWLLTRNDGRHDGALRGYLRQPERWRNFDPELFEKMCKLFRPSVAPEIAHARKWGLLPNATYFENHLVDNEGDRDKYFWEAFKKLHKCQILFFDPDNGIEVKSTRPGNSNSAKYLFWKEIKQAYGMCQ